MFRQLLLHYQCAVKRHCPWEIGSMLAEKVGQGELGAPKGSQPHGSVWTWLEKALGWS